MIWIPQKLFAVLAAGAVVACPGCSCTDTTDIVAEVESAKKAQDQKSPQPVPLAAPVPAPPPSETSHGTSKSGGGETANPISGVDRPSSDGARSGGARPGLSVAEARAAADKLADQAAEAFAAGKPGEAFQKALRGYELLAPHGGDPQCRDLRDAIVAELRRYGAAANAEPRPDSFPRSRLQ